MPLVRKCQFAETESTCKEELVVMNFLLKKIGKNPESQNITFWHFKNGNF